MSDRDEAIGLTEAQLSMRATVLGASELPSILELDPWGTPIEVWASKATPSRAPIPSDRSDSVASWLGHELEPIILRRFARETGIEVMHNRTTMAHPTSPVLVATPDGIGDGIIVQCKNVGAQVAERYWSDGLPDYVRTQVLGELDVMQSARVCYVAAILGGARFEVHAVERTDECELLREAAETWWVEYILGDTPPPTRTIEERRAALALRYPTADETKALVQVEPGSDIAELVRWRQFGTKIRDVAAERVREIDTTILEMLGPSYGAAGDFGKVLALHKRGSPQWKEIAAELAGGAVPESIIEAHRGATSREVRVYEQRPKALKGPKR